MKNCLCKIFPNAGGQIFENYVGIAPPTWVKYYAYSDLLLTSYKMKGDNDE